MSKEDQNTSRRDLLKLGAGATAAAAAIGFTRPAMAEHHESITQIVQFKLNPDKADEAEAALKTLTKAVEDNEPDVLAYIAYRSDAEPDTVVFFEMYKDEAAMAAHGKQPHLGEMRKVFAAGVFKPPLKIEKMNKVGGFMR
jgi:quinol monooxygenase YgiN